MANHEHLKPKIHDPHAGYIIQNPEDWLNQPRPLYIETGFYHDSHVDVNPESRIHFPPRAESAYPRSSGRDIPGERFFDIPNKATSSEADRDLVVEEFLEAVQQDPVVTTVAETSHAQVATETIPRRSSWLETAKAFYRRHTAKAQSDLKPEPSTGD